MESYRQTHSITERRESSKHPLRILKQPDSPIPVSENSVCTSQAPKNPVSFYEP